MFSSLQVNGGSSKGFEGGSYKSRIDAEKRLVEELRAEWKLLWAECFNDKVRAEDVSLSNCEALRIERGTVIQASRDFKALSFREILEQHKIENSGRFIQPDVNAGGWHKFVKTQITTQKQAPNKQIGSFVAEKRFGVQAKKNGRGWLHST